MAWENAEMIFHQKAIQIDGQLIPVSDLKNTDIEIINNSTEHIARNMIIKKETYVWGKNGEYAHGVDYDVLNCLPRPEEDVPALSVYGMRMLRDYYYMNNIPINT